MESPRLTVRRPDTCGCSTWSWRLWAKTASLRVSIRRTIMVKPRDLGIAVLALLAVAFTALLFLLPV